MIQSITYKEFLPILMGNDGMNEYDLKLESGRDHFDDYDSNTDPTIFNSFATAAFRYIDFSEK